MKIVSLIINAIARIVSFILIKLGLFLPFLYVSAFLATCAVKDIALEGAVMNVLVVGIIITIIFGLALSSIISLNNKQNLKIKDKDNTPQSENNLDIDTKPARKVKTKKQIIGSEFVRLPSDNLGSNNSKYKVITGVNFEPEKNTFSQVTPLTGRINEPMRASRISPNNIEWEKKYFQDFDVQITPTPIAPPTPMVNQNPVISQSPIIPQSPLMPQSPIMSQSPTFNPTSIASSIPESTQRPTPREATREISKVDARDSRQLVTEQPMVFATRKDPNILVHEYSDRLQVYKKTSTGLELILTEYKNE